MPARTTTRNRAGIADRLDQLSSTISAQHVEVCERLTRLETQFAGLPERVGLLENLKYQALGAISIVTVTLSLLVSWFRKSL